jgi:hypothetical protein
MYATRVPSVHYKIFDDRIMKSGDIRYFDHPKFGLLIKIIRYEKPEDDDQELEDEEKEEEVQTSRGTILSNTD